MSSYLCGLNTSVFYDDSQDVFFLFKYHTTYNGLQFLIPWQFLKPWRVSMEHVRQPLYLDLESFFQYQFLDLEV